MEFDENSRKPEDQEAERGVWGGNRNLKGGFLIGSLSPLGCRFPPQEFKVTPKLRMMIRAPYPVSDNPDSDAVGLNYTARYSHGSRREALSEMYSRLCI